MRNSNFPIVLWLLVIIGFIALYFFGLNFLPFLGPDEPRYAQVAREMFERGDWVTPTLGGHNWFEKPALLYWLQIIAYNIFGVNEFAARFFSAIFGLLTILGVYRICKRVENVSQKRSSSYSRNYEGIAKFSAIALATSIGLIVFSRGASFDIILTFPIALALICFFTFELYAPHSYSDNEFQGYFISDVGYLAFFYVLIGVALLAKGLIGIVIPFGVIFTYYLFQFRFPPRLFVFSWFWGIPLALAVSCIWYVPMYLTHDYVFIDEFFIQHHFNRYTSNQYKHPGPFVFFWYVLPLMTLPWLFWLILAFFNIGTWRRGIAQTPVDYLRTFALAWMLFPIFFFTFSGSKLPGYILPALPGAMILIGDRLRRMVARNQSNEWLVFGISSGTIIACFIAILVLSKSYAATDTVKFLIENANQNGYQNAKVLNLHDVSHSAEFYANTRLVRDEKGKLRKFESVADVAEIIKNEGKPVLVLVPKQHINQLTENETLTANVLGDNGELAIVGVSLK
ncbi:MAG: glycosyltransferase family 39 protein [Pyrinomonadaceae bacterium]|nr:glycosyltransferase family 39 protein [Pyrinomonadaceae bacterium]